MISSNKVGNPYHDAKGLFTTGPSFRSDNHEYDLENEDDHASLLDRTLEKPLSSKEEQAFEKYTANDYLSINQGLRYKLGVDTTHMDAVFRRAKLPINLETYRQVDRETYERILQGGEYHDRAFVSTTAKRSLLPDNNYVLTVQLPKGSRAIPVGSLSDRAATEAEVLVNRGSRFKLVSNNNGRLTIRLEK